MTLSMILPVTRGVASAGQSAVVAIKDPHACGADTGTRQIECNVWKHTSGASGASMGELPAAAGLTPAGTLAQPGTSKPPQRCSFLDLLLNQPLESVVRPPNAKATKMPLRLYNTLTRQVDDFQPLEGNTARMYTCGP